MSVNYIYIENGQKRARTVTSAETYRALRNSSAQVANLSQARQGNEAAKRRLVQFNYSGHYPEGVVKGTKLPSAAFGFDLDNPDDFQRVSAQLLANPEQYGLLMLERSARQGGHAVFRREMGRTILENQVRIACALKCEMDTSAHDINRVYFSTTAAADELLYLSPQLFQDPYAPDEVEAEAKRLDERERSGQEELPPDAHKANKHYKPWSTAEASELPQQASAQTSPQPAKNYLGIPYDLIISKWWKMYNGGLEPVQSNRDVLTFELAVNLRHICGFDRQLMAQVIPCYDGFPEIQKMKCIDSALSERRTMIPKRLRDVLTAVRQDLLNTTDMADTPFDGSTLEEIFTQDDRLYYNALPKMPQGVDDSVQAVGPALAMPVITAICPAIGMLATEVRIEVHGKMQPLNLISYIAGDFASGKGSIDPIIEAWTGEVKVVDKMYLQQEAEWRTKKRAAKNKKEQPEEPKLPVRCLTLNNTVANLAERLANTEGKHAFSFTPEADTVAQKWRTALGDFSVMLRQAYDGSPYEREARSADAVNVHIDRLLWNVVMCGTPDALYRVVSNYTDGFQSRIAVARTPDNTFTPLTENLYVLTDRQRERIQMIAHLLPLMQGDLALPRLEAKGREWLEQIRLESIKNDDKTKARQRFRICPTTMRMMTCLILCRVAERLIKEHGMQGAEMRLKQNPSLWKELAIRLQSPQMLSAFDVLANYQLDNALYFFRDRIEAAFNSRDYNAQAGKRCREGKNDSIFARLDDVFTCEQAACQSALVKGEQSTHEAVKQMLKNWKKQGLVARLADGRFQKLQER